MTKFVTGFNMPGYLPESSPIAHANFDSAKRGLIHELKQQEDGAETEEDAETFCHMAEEINLWDSPQTTPTMPDGYVYWIAEAEESNEEEEQ